MVCRPSRDVGEYQEEAGEALGEPNSLPSAGLTSLGPLPSLGCELEMGANVVSILVSLLRVVLGPAGICK
jgi:hypothetical protein